MADKKKPGSATEDRQQESDRQFLERTNVSSMMKGVIAKIIENRPEDPVAFLAEYFENFGDKSSKVSQAHQHLLLTHHSRPAFESNMKTAYELLGQHRGNRTTKGVNGLVFSELIQMICSDLAESVKEKLFKKLECRESDAIIYDVFRSGVFTCFVLKDFIKQAESLYDSIDLQHTGAADKILCDAVLHQVLLAVSSSENDPNSVMEIGYSLAPDRLYLALNKSVSSSPGVKGTMKKEDFVLAAVESFLLKVNMPS